MSYSIVHNRYRKSTTILVTGNCSIAIAGTEGVSDIAINDENLLGATIRKISWGADPGTSIVLRRGPAMLGIFDSTNSVDYAGNGMSITLGGHLPLVISFVGSPGSGYCFLELGKITDIDGVLNPNYVSMFTVDSALITSDSTLVTMDQNI